MTRLIPRKVSAAENATTVGFNGEVLGIPGTGIAIHDGITPGGVVLQDRPGTPAENLVRNGNFIVAQNGTSWLSIPTSGSFEYIADGWYFHRGGNSTANAATSRSIAADLPDAYTALRITTTSGGLASSFSVLSQQIANVQLVAGKTVTVSFWAKTTSTRRIAVSIRQDYDSAKGSVETFAGNASLTTNWSRYSFTVNVPASVPADVVGINSFTGLWIWLEAGSNYDNRTGSIGEQSGQTDIANVKLEIGEIATDFGPHSYVDELLKVKRYYEKSTQVQFLCRGAYSDAGKNDAVGYVKFDTEKVAAPVVTVSGDYVAGLAAFGAGAAGFSVLGVPNNATSVARITGYTANAEIEPY